MPTYDEFYQAPPRPAQVITLPSHMAHHHHDYTQIVIGLSGRAEFDVEGEVNLIGPGQGCIVRASSEHRFGGIGSSDILVLNFLDTLNIDSQVAHLLEDLLSEEVYFQLDFEIQQLIQMLVREIKASPEDMLLCRACQDTIIALLHRHIKKFEMYKKGHRLNMDLLDRYILQHLSSKITVADLSACAFLGESQFHLLFKAQVGMTPHQYVLTKRIEESKRLIKEGQYSFGHIAEVVGFSAQSVFTHSFTRMVGMSPSQYRQDY
ncbi:helix-turn-helix transcriptional regulator [Vibrio algivorus]|uniref:AraC family transcriptional regulator n=1 Tax=Vibrio algivorus TaxID=1667024 RepID=A0ABQ6EKS4_9VIBR|nr:AraC family transcriptional regulator [Vibrio algivorus]GLT13490.1 AraC family transcriptional regulator [Vibrio algivorus]